MLYIAITIVQSSTGKYHEFVAICIVNKDAARVTLRVTSVYIGFYLRLNSEH